MKIACLGWGSLIWDPGKLKIKSRWFAKGPFLPIEFLRVSGNKRITLVIDRHKDTKQVMVLWARMSVDDLNQARESLQDREGVPSIDEIHHVSRDEEVPAGSIKRIIQKWLKKRDLDAVIWTGLSWDSKRGKQEFGEKRPTKYQVISYLKKKLKGEDLKLAREYVQKAPKQINTIYREEIENKLGWKCDQ